VHLMFFKTGGSVDLYLTLMFSNWIFPEKGQFEGGFEALHS